jgi:AraC family transcriptional regulator, activator of mtrCDE
MGMAIVSRLPEAGSVAVAQRPVNGRAEQSNVPKDQNCGCVFPGIGRRSVCGVGAAAPGPAGSEGRLPVWRTMAGAHEAAGNGLAYFHIVTRGSCRIERRDSDVITLEAGDVLLLPHGEKHVVGSCTKGPAGTITIEYRNAIRAKSTGSNKTDTEIICGRLCFEAGEDNVLAAALPDTMVLHTAERPSVERFRRILMDIREELDSEDPGSNLIATNLASALFVMMIRLHLQQVPERRSMLSLLQNRTTSKAVIAMLKAPSKDWTLDDMAAAAVTSRVTLVRAFRSVSGLAPMAYLGALRLDLARRRLSETKDSMGEVAATVGYKSEGALSKAFLRRFGVRPGAVRQR